jgi:membrane-associated phospholipid phosphatase
MQEFLFLWLILKSMKYFCLFIISLFVLNTHAQVNDTTKTKIKFIQTKGFKIAVVPLAFTTVSVLTSFHNGVLDKYSTKEFRDRNFPNYHTKLDDYIMFSPIAAVYGFDFVGIHAKNDFLNRSIILAKAEAINEILTLSLKSTLRVMRPDSSARNSYPSGHTSQAFVAATFLHKELGDQSIWYSIGGYSVATFIACSRMLNNRHWLSDVLFGAGIGIFSANLAYATHQYRWKYNKREMTIVPVFGNKTGIIAINIDF